MLSAGQILGVAVLALSVAGATRADSIGYTVYFTGASIAIDNDSDVWDITEVSVTIGDTNFNYDSANGTFVTGGAGSTFNLVSPDSVDGAVRSDVLSFTFTGFDPGDRFNSDVDIDPDSGDSACCNLSGVLFNNGAAENAVVTVGFSDGIRNQFLDNLMIDTSSVPDPGGTLCTVFGECKFINSFDLPEPAALLLVGLSAVAFAARRLGV